MIGHLLFHPFSDDDEVLKGKQLLSSVEVIVSRVGGAYGGKASRSALIACACALVAYKLNRTATLVMPLVDNMEAIGKRQECDVDYEVSYDLVRIILDAL